MWWRRVVNVFRSRAVETDAARELAFHVAERADELEAQGLTRAAAEREAKRRLGHELVHRERMRDADLLGWLDTLLRDVRYAFASVRVQPAHTLIVVLTLALGIGANVAVFSVLRAVLLGPLPVADADQVVTVTERRLTSNDADLPVSGHEFVAWAERSRSFDRLALYHGGRQNLTGAGEPEFLDVLRVSDEYFPLLGLSAAQGRVLGSAASDGDAVAVLSDELWRRRFNADERVIGATVTLDNRAFTVIGVMPPLPSSLAPDVWVPLDVAAEARAVGRHNLSVLGRLAAGVTISQAHGDLDRIAAQLQAERPSDNTDHRVHVAPLRAALVGEFRRPLLMLAIGVAFVLLIACANVANLLLARTARRRREFAVRTALGATRWRIIRQLLLESTALAVLGGSVGVLLARLVVAAVARVTALPIPLLETVRLDWQALAVAAAVTVVAGFFVGIAPALRWARPAAGPLRESSRTTDGHGRRIRALLVTAEVALTVVLLVGTGLMMNSFLRLLRVDAGFDERQRVVLPIDLPATRYPDAQQQRAFVQRLTEDLRSIPGVQSVGAISHLPLSGADNWMPFQVAGRPAPAPGQEPRVPVRIVTTGYFDALGIPLLRGRVFNDNDARRALPLVRWYAQQPYPEHFDAPQAAPVAVISDAAAREYWPGEDPIGKRIRVLFSPEITIVGVVGDVRHSALNVPPYPHIYMSHNQEPWNSLSIVVRSDRAVSAQLYQRVRALDADLPISVRKLDDVRAASVARPRLFMQLSGVFAAIALGLALIGIAGVVSQIVGERTREIGLRVALGAQRRDILRMILRQGMQPIVAGILIGSAGALVLTRFIEALLFDIRPADPTTFVIVLGFLVTVALGACLIPAARALRMDPVAALRSE